MCKVVIFGTGNFSNVVEKSLDDNVEIIAYSDNDVSKWGKKKKERLIVSPNQIARFEYDYIIIASQYNEEIYKQLLEMGINNNKIFQFPKVIDKCWNEYEQYINSFTSQLSENYELLVTGISYANLGFRRDVICKKSFKFTFGSQDLFYDYQTIKYLVENYEKELECIKYVVIGLCYYSFQYDMSLSSMKGKTILYYNVLKNSHNFNEIERVYTEYVENKKIADKILRKNSDGNYDFKVGIYEFQHLDNKDEVGKKQAEIDCNKNYPETVKENIEIFEAYLKLLKNNDIKPIVVVFPAAKYYTKHFSSRIEDEFNNIIQDTKKKFDFQYIDYFRSNLFNDDDFQDVSHLNFKGSEKFTKILNEIIEW